MKPNKQFQRAVLASLRSARPAAELRRWAPMGITQYRLAKEIGVPQRRIGEIVAGTRGVTADTGLRLARFFGMSEDFWIGLQMDYEAAHAKDVLFKTLAKITPWRVGARRTVLALRARPAAESAR